MNDLIIKLFGKAVVETKTKLTKAQEQKLVLELAELGYIVHPEVLSSSVVQYLRATKRNLNASFYKNWKDVTSKTRLELLVDQLLHYASTYGTGFEGEPFIPNDNVSCPAITEFKVIQPITEKEVLERCSATLYSGIALTQETIEEIFLIGQEIGPLVLDVELVRNREARLILFTLMGKIPKDPVEMVRYLVYMATTKTMLIKDKETIEAVKASSFEFTKLIQEFGVVALSSIFYRFRPLFLAMRNTKQNKRIINELRRAARTNHKPMEIGLLERLLAGNFRHDELYAALDKATNFKKITLLQLIKKRLLRPEYEAYVVRNQKLFVKESYRGKLLKDEKNLLNGLYKDIYGSLVTSLARKACNVRLAKGVNITLPTSGKSFIGNYPLGSSFEFGNEDCIIGIHWRGEEGADDLDFSLINTKGDKFGWNANYTDSYNSIVYSGDMTSANPEASELFYMRRGLDENAIAKVNMYRGEPNAKFRFFLAKEKLTGMRRGYMVNPSNVKFTFEGVMDSKEKMLGVIANGRFVLANFRTGKGNVSGESVTNLYTEHVMETLDCYLSLSEVLNDAGFQLFTPGTKSECEIDLNNLQKDTLINLLS